MQNRQMKINIQELDVNLLYTVQILLAATPNIFIQCCIYTKSLKNI